MIVVDTNIIAYLFLASERSAQAELALAKDSQWAAPVLWRSEFRNVLAFYMRRRILTPQDAGEIMNAATELLAQFEYEIPSHSVLTLAHESNCSAYDCEFVALAQDLQVPLVTTDRQLLAQFPKTVVSLEAFTRPS